MVRLAVFRVRRGPNGLGLDLGPFNRVGSLVPGSPAAEQKRLTYTTATTVDITGRGVGTLREEEDEDLA